MLERKDTDDSEFVEDDEELASTYAFRSGYARGIVLMRCHWIVFVNYPNTIAYAYAHDYPCTYVYVHAHREETVGILEKTRLRDLSGPQSQSQSLGGALVLWRPFTSLLFFLVSANLTLLRLGSW